MALRDDMFTFSDIEASVLAMGLETPTWDFPRGPSGAQVLVELAVRLGLDEGAFLSATDLDLAGLDDSESVVLGGQELKLIRNIVRLTSDRPGLGVEVGSRITLGMLGIWGFAMLLSPTVEAVLEVALRHGHGKLSWIFLKPELKRERDHVRLELDAGEVPGDVKNFILERDLTGTATVIPAIVGGPIPLRIETTLPGPRRRALAAALPHAAIVRHSTHNAVILENSVLRHRLPTAHPMSVALYERQCRDIVNDRARRIGLAGQIRSALLHTPGYVPTLRQIALERHLDPRTLRRRLDAEGASFRELRAQACHALAIELITAGELSIAEVALRLGYSDSAAFSRAFKRWTGHSPSIYASRQQPQIESSGAVRTSPAEYSALV